MIPDLSVLWVIFFVLLITTLLNLLLFKPLLAVMHKREGAVQSARALAAPAAETHNRRPTSSSRAPAARTEVSLQMDATRREAEERRAQLLAAAREQAGATPPRARGSGGAAETRARRIERDADVLAGAIVERVLGRPTT